MTISQTNVRGDLVLDLAASSHSSVHRQVASAVRTAIRSGRLPVGAALPPSRRLAEDLRCSRWVVTEAYAQLVAEGYLHARTGSATLVRWAGSDARRADPAAVPPRGRPRIDLAPGLPDSRHFPRRRWSQALAKAVDRAPIADLGYPDPVGDPTLRNALAEQLNRSRGVRLRGADLVVTTSASTGVSRICRALVAAGVTRIAVEDPGWRRMHDVARTSGLHVEPIAVDSDGLDLAALSGKSGVGAVIVSPAHQFPTGVVMSPERRAALLRWADDENAVVIEDDYDAEFRYDRAPIASLQSMSPSRVALVGSLSKTLSPALGIGWMVVPTWLAQRVLDGEVGSSVPPTLDQIAFAGFLLDGGYDRHLRASRRRYRTRRDRLLSGLSTAAPGLRLTGAAAGLHLTARLPRHAPSATHVAARAANQGMRLATVAQYHARAEDADPRCLVLGYGNLTDAAVPDAVRLLAGIITEPS